MTDYAKVHVGAIYSASSDYSDPIVQQALASWDLTPTEFQSRRVVAPTGGMTLSIASYTTVSAVIVKNNDTTNYVTVGVTSAAANGAFALQVAAGAVIVLTDIKISTGVVLTANTAAVQCDVITIGD